MRWNIAEAKQRLSEVIRASSQEAQMIYNRDVPVAVVIAAEELADYEAWKQSRTQQSTLADEFIHLRSAAAGHRDPLPDVNRMSLMRPNAFDSSTADESQNLDGDAAIDATR
jgi:prevent-host-death family protein